MLPCLVALAAPPFPSLSALAAGQRLDVSPKTLEKAGWWLLTSRVRWCGAILTREELPAKPDSGSGGSSTVEPVQETRTRTTKALLSEVLMRCVERFASMADEAGRRPLHTLLLSFA